MCHTIKRLFFELCVKTVVHEINGDPNGEEIKRALSRLLGHSCPLVPVVFIGGRMLVFRVSHIHWRKI